MGYSFHRIELIRKLSAFKSKHNRPNKDAMMLHEEFGKYDKVMIDAPYSGLGVIRENQISGQNLRISTL